MQGSRTRAALCVWAVVAVASAAAGDPLDLARQRLAGKDAPGAVAALEAAIPGVRGEQRRDVLTLLRQAYTEAASQAAAAGRPDEAEEYRENLAILERTPRAPADPPRPKAVLIQPRVEAPTSPAAPVVEAPIPLPALPVTEAPAADPAPPVDRTIPNAPRPAQAGVAQASKAAVEPIPTLPRDEPPASSPAPPLSEPPPQPPPTGSPGALSAATPAAEVPVRSITLPSTAAQPNTPEITSIEAADSAFVAKRYDEAGRAYSALDKARKLPPDRKDHWAYCRAVDVVRRINARPASQAEWAAIDHEIETIRALSPSNWFAEYLRNRAAERNPGGRSSKPQRSGKVVVRGSSPEEDPAPSAPQPRSKPEPPPAAGPAPKSGVSWAREPVATANFQVVYPEGHRDLADRAAQAAEAARDAGLKRWGDPNKGSPWSPRCELVIFPDANHFSRETGQPADSPGFSSMGMSDGKVTLRRVHLRADHPNAVKAILPHEVTHVVLADLFPLQQIPRWADEGMAVLSEPASEQGLRAADLNEPLAAGRLFRLKDLTAMDYPDPKHWSLYYAQSVSLTRYLVAQGTPAQFVAFVQESQKSGFEPALIRAYKIAGYADLHARWSAFAKANASAEMTASADGRKGDAAAR